MILREKNTIIINEDSGNSKINRDIRTETSFKHYYNHMLQAQIW